MAAPMKPYLDFGLRERCEGGGVSGPPLNRPGNFTTGLGPGDDNRHQLLGWSQASVVYSVDLSKMDIHGLEGANV